VAEGLYRHLYDLWLTIIALLRIHNTLVRRFQNQIILNISCGGFTTFFAVGLSPIIERQKWTGQGNDAVFARIHHRVLSSAFVMLCSIPHCPSPWPSSPRDAIAEKLWVGLLFATGHHSRSSTVCGLVTNRVIGKVGISSVAETCRWNSTPVEDPGSVGLSYAFAKIIPAEPGFQERKGPSVCLRWTGILIHFVIGAVLVVVHNQREAGGCTVYLIIIVYNSTSLPMGFLR
jgi:hypothetical protein